MSSDRSEFSLSYGQPEFDKVEPDTNLEPGNVAVKDRVKSRVWWLVGTNAVVLMMVLLLAYGAGARSGGLSLLDFGALPQVAGLEFLAALFLVIAMSLALLIHLGLKVVKPTRELMEISEKVVGGDYETLAKVTPDDFGVMAENWNRAAEMVAQSAAIKAGAEMLHTELAELERALNHAARGDLSVRTKASHMSLTAVADAYNSLADNYARRMERVRAITADVGASALQVLATAGELTNGAAEQEQKVLNAAAAIAELTTNTQQVSARAGSASQAGRDALALAEEGSRAVRGTADGMKQIRSAMQLTAEKIRSLGERSLQIYEIINIIHETNLLALNAVLEFSRRGEAPTQEVISAELRKLADHSRTATRDIVGLLKSIQAESTDAVSIIEQGLRVAESGSRLSEQSGQALAGITNDLQHTLEHAAAICASANEQLHGTERVAAAVQEIAANLRQTSSKSRQSAKTCEQVVRCSEQLTHTVSQTRGASAPAVMRQEAPKKPEAAAAVVVGSA